MHISYQWTTTSFDFESNLAKNINIYQPQKLAQTFNETLIFKTDQILSSSSFISFQTTIQALQSLHSEMLTECFLIKRDFLRVLSIRKTDSFQLNYHLYCIFYWKKNKMRYAWDILYKMRKLQLKYCEKIIRSTHNILAILTKTETGGLKIDQLKW